MITWEYFSKRRNINLKDFIRKQEINTYEKLHAFCDGRSVISPTKDEYDLAYSTVFSTVVEAKPPAKPPAKPKLPKKKRSYTRKKKPPVKGK